MVHAMGISTAMVRFLHEWAEDKGEERRGGPLDAAGVRAVVPPKEEERREGKGGVQYGGRGMRVESRPDVRKMKSTQCTRTASMARCRDHAKTGCYRFRHRRRSQGTQRNDPACVARSTKHRAWDMTSTQTFPSTPYYRV